MCVGRGRIAALCVTLFICLTTISVVECIQDETDEEIWNTKAADVNSIFTGGDMDAAEMQRLLDAIPRKRMDNLKAAAKHILGNAQDDEFQRTLMKLAEAEGLLHPSNRQESKRNGDSANRTRLPSSGNKAGRKVGGKSGRVKEAEPMDAILGLAKKYLGHDESDPTLDLMANMASAYMKSAQKKSGGGKGGEGINLESMMRMASMLSSAGDGKQKNPLDAVSSLMANSGMDAGQLLQMASSLIGQPQGASGRKGSTSDRSPIIDLIAGYLGNFINVDSSLIVQYYEALVRLSGAKSWSEINMILKSSFGTDAESFLNLMADDNSRRSLSENGTEQLVSWIQHILDPDSVKTKISFVNEFLAQASLPVIDHKNVIETTSVVCDRIAKVYAGREVNSRVTLKAAQAQLKAMLGLDPSDAIDLHNYSAEDLADAVGYYVKSEFFDVLADIWSDFKLASRHPKCARTVICVRNSPQSVRTSLGLKQATTRSASTILAWALEKTNNRGMPSFDVLYHAAWNSKANCHEKYKENCQEILKDRHRVIKKGYEHYEL